MKHTTIFVSLLIAYVNAAQNPDDPCYPQRCTVFENICVTLDDGSHEKFLSDCAYDAFKCEYPDRKVVSVDPCEKYFGTTIHKRDVSTNCKRECSIYIYYPICVTYADGSTDRFLNRCFFEESKCELPDKIINTAKRCPLNPPTQKPLVAE